MANDFKTILQTMGCSLTTQIPDTIQINITKQCNQSCVHCHVDASPKRHEHMSDEVLDQVIRVLSRDECLTTLDITGGAPELHPRFRELVREARTLEKKVIVRHNLTVSLDPHPSLGTSLSYLPEFFSQMGVELVSSLPCYMETNTDQQRGHGVYSKSIAALKKLNAFGYGHPHSGLIINLVYNPHGAFLPPDPYTLEKKYKDYLQDTFGILFNRLFVMTNMPIHRYKAYLVRHKSYDQYMELLRESFNDLTVDKLMCRHLISVGPDGEIFHCDFNQMLKIPFGPPPHKLTIFNYSSDLARDVQINVASHCFGCTAGAGSSCFGSTAPELTSKNLAPNS
jgi:radical SAM/Cys-rich protein